MGMHNPPHPGEFIREVYLDSFHLSARQVAAKLRVSPSTFNRVLKGWPAPSCPTTPPTLDHDEGRCIRA
jgi:addiction module HigA family antidote